MNLIKKLKLKQGTKAAWNTIKRVDKKLLKKKAESAGVFAKKHGKKVGVIAVKSAVATASAFSPMKKIKLVGKGVKAVSTGAHKVLTSPIAKKSVKKFEKVVGTGLNVATKATVVGTVLGLAATYSAIGKGINLGTKAYKKSKPIINKLKNKYTNPK